MFDDFLNSIKANKSKVAVEDFVIDDGRGVKFRDR